MKVNIKLKSNVYPVTCDNPLHDPKFTRQITNVVSLEKTIERCRFDCFPLTTIQSKLLENGSHCSVHPELERVCGVPIRAADNKITMRCSYVNACEHVARNGGYRCQL